MTPEAVPDADLVWHDDFERRGWAIVPVERPDLIDGLRERVRAVTASHLGLDSPPELDLIHEHLADPAASEALRLRITEQLRTEASAGRIVFECFAGALGSLVGADVLAQRAPNVVLQPPRHPIPTELHRDAPANSPFEVVVWLPLVDCAGTKSMYVLDRDATAEALALYRDDPADTERFDLALERLAVPMEVRYGSALLFWTGLLHGSRINAESTTRVSLNTRYKALLAPLGMKDPYRYFEVLRTSPLTRLGLGFDAGAAAVRSHPE